MSNESGIDLLIGLALGVILATGIVCAFDDRITPKEYARYVKACDLNGGVDVINVSDDIVTCNNGAKFDYNDLYRSAVYINGNLVVEEFDILKQH